MVNNGEDTLFWKDIWLGNQPLCTRFPRLFRIETDKDARVADKIVGDGVTRGVSWSWIRNITGRLQADAVQNEEEIDVFFVNVDGWKWSGQSNGLFSTSVLIDLINEKVSALQSSAAPALRNNLVLKKIEVFVWRVRKNRLPVRVELDKRGIDLGSTWCPVCDNDIETVVHSLFHCSFANQIWARLF
ncbi:uncharacterized protein [Rutidosis leptorrhynchoides]|uniref:uncharacterized protein n=1 Tax=Rutidosis leptorrhynchoides TaxID=125765 RepID=UPI003A9A59F0